MLTIVKRILPINYCFASSTRRRSQKQPAEDKEAFKTYRKQVEKSSILRQFRQDVWRKSQLSSQWEQVQQEKKETQKLRKYLNVDKEQMLERATMVEARVIQQRTPFEENTGRSLVSDYGNYKSYDKVHPFITDRNLGEKEYIQDSEITQNLYQFIDKLPDEYQEKEEIQAIIGNLPATEQNMSIAQYGKKMQDQINRAQRQNLRKYEGYKIHEEQKYARVDPGLDDDQDIDQDWFQEAPQDCHQDTGIPRTIDPWNNQSGLEASLSPAAIDNIYDLYLQGWTVRQISKRYGILPARAKFCVWVRAQLYHEIIPKLGVRYYIRALRFQEKFNQEQSFCDYGLDIQELSNENIVQEITEWNGKMLDAQRQQEPYIDAMMRLQKQKKFGKYEMVQVGLINKEHQQYRLKEWKIFRGKGSDEYFLRNRWLKTLTKAQQKFNKVYY